MAMPPTRAIRERRRSIGERLTVPVKGPGLWECGAFPAPGVWGDPIAWWGARKALPDVE